MPLKIDPIEQQAKTPLEKKPSTDPQHVAIYRDLFSLQNTFRILFFVLDKIFKQIQDYVNNIPGGGSGSYVPGKIYPCNPTFKLGETSSLPVEPGKVIAYPVFISAKGKFSVQIDCISGTDVRACRFGLYVTRTSDYAVPTEPVVDFGSILVTGKGEYLSEPKEVSAGNYAFVMFTQEGANPGITLSHSLSCEIPKGVTNFPMEPTLLADLPIAAAVSGPHTFPNPTSSLPSLVPATMGQHFPTAPVAHRLIAAVL